MEKILVVFDGLLKRRISRKGFLKLCATAMAYIASGNRFLRLALAAGSESQGRQKSALKGEYDLVVAEGQDPYLNTVKAIEAMGGMARFVKKGAVVVIKPNIGWDRTPAQAADTDPQVVAALVDLCYKAEAKRVNVFDIPCNDPRRCYENSGIQEAAKQRGAYVYFVDNWDMIKAKFKYPSKMEGWPIYRDAVECDTFINVPVLKHHGLTGLTLSMKNLMGVCGSSRGIMHQNIGPDLVDVTDFISPELTVIDATRVLVRNGPTGGDLDDVIAMNKVIVSTDSTLADSYACSLLNKDPMTVPNIKEAVARNFGNADISKANIHTLRT